MKSESLEPCLDATATCARTPLQSSCNLLSFQHLFGLCVMFACLHLFTQGPANVDAIGVLVEAGADTAAVTDAASQETPLHIAARSGRVDVVNKLLACKVTLLSRTKVGGGALRRVGMRRHHSRTCMPGAIRKLARPEYAAGSAGAQDDVSLLVSGPC